MFIRVITPRATYEVDTNNIEEDEKDTVIDWPVSRYRNFLETTGFDNAKHMLYEHGLDDLPSADEEYTVYIIEDNGTEHGPIDLHKGGPVMGDDSWEYPNDWTVEQIATWESENPFPG